jgi:hypothetical protein
MFYCVLCWFHRNKLLLIHLLWVYHRRCIIKYSQLVPSVYEPPSFSLPLYSRCIFYDVIISYCVVSMLG